MSGYSKRVIRLDFPGLTDDDVKDPVWVAIRNPRLVPPHELVPQESTPIVEGQPVNPQAANRSMHEMFSRLIVGWRAYDATTPIQLDAAGNDVTPQVLLPADFAPENVARLPLELINEIGREVREASNPR